MSRTLRAASAVSAFTLLSRVLGFVRDVFMFRLLGTSWTMGTFILAWMVPNLLRRLMGEGALSASFIPAYSRTLDAEGEARARRLLASVTGALIVGLTALAVLVVATVCMIPAHWLADDQANGVSGAESGALLARLLAILFPYVVLVCTTAVYSGALNAHDRFALPAAMPVVLNIAWIGGLVVGCALHPDDPAAAVTITALFLIGAGVLQVGSTGWLLWRIGGFGRPQWPPPGDPARAVFRSMLPTLVGMSVLQINTLLDQAIAYYWIAPGANSHVYMANRLLLFPHALTGLALATAVFPQFAVHASRGELEQLSSRIGATLRTTLTLSVPAALGLCLIAGDFMEVFFVGGEYDADDARWSARTTVCLVIGLPFLAVAQLYARVLFAFGDTATPARVAAWLVPCNLLLNVIFVGVLRLGVPGLTLATTACSALNAVLLARKVAQRCTVPPVMAPWLLRVAAAAVAMALVVFAVQSIPAPEFRWARGALLIALPVVAGGLAFGAFLVAIGGPDPRQLLRRRR